MIDLKRSLWMGVALFGALSTGLASMPPMRQVEGDKAAMAKSVAAKRPPAFVENKGQWPAEARFLARSGATNLWVTDRGLMIDHVNTESTAENKSLGGHIVRLDYDNGGKSFRSVGFGPQTLRTDFLGRQAGTKATGARNFAGVLDKNVFPGVDVKHHFDGRTPRFDFIVAPKADPRAIRLRLRGTEKSHVDEKGNLVYSTEVGDRKFAGLFAFQVVDGKRVPVPVKFSEVGTNLFAFRLGNYDRSRELVIDPLIYGSYFGGDDGADEVMSVATDDKGGTYLVGRTRSIFFPQPLQQSGGPYGINIVGGYDGFISKLQGDAYFYDYNALIGGTGDDVASRVAVDPFGDVWVAGFTDSTDFPIARPSQTFEILLTDHDTGFEAPVNGGNYQIRIFGQGGGVFTTSPIAWNANAAAVRTAIEAVVPGAAGNVTVTGGAPAIDPSGFRVAFNSALPVEEITILDEYPNTDGDGLVTHVLVDPALFPGQDRATTHASVQTIRRIGSIPANRSGAWTPLSSGWRINHEGTWTPWMSAGASAGTVQAALREIVEADPPEVFVSGGPLTTNVPFTVVITSTAPTNFMFVQYRFQAPSHYRVRRVQDMWLMRFRQSTDPTQKLTPFEDGVTQGLIIPTNGGATLATLAIAPVADPTPATPVRLFLAGGTRSAITRIAAPFFGDVPLSRNGRGYVLTMDYRNGTFTNVANTSFYLNELAPVELTGLAVDAQGSIYLSGGVIATLNQNTSTASNPMFVTTPGVFSGGRILNFSDLWARKYSTVGSLVYSALIGGSQDEIAGGFFAPRNLPRFAQTPWEQVGPTIAVDQQGNAYVTGLSGSFDYPRTRGVVGEVFNGSNVHAVVTKLNPDASAILYSTHLLTGSPGFRYPRYGAFDIAGIDVDPRGQVYVTGRVGNYMDFADPEGNDPDADIEDQPAPTDYPFQGSITPTADALSGAIAPQTAKNNTDAFVIALNPTATALAYASYLGSTLDDKVYAPYTDKFGDLWIVGRTDMFRGYWIPSQRQKFTNEPLDVDLVEVFAATQLPGAYITDRAFKQTPEWQSPDPTGFDEILEAVQYGSVNVFDDTGMYRLLFRHPYTLPMRVRADGFVLKMRLGLPVISSITISDSVLPGGDPQGGTNPPATNVTVNLSGPAPAGGVTLRLDTENPVEGGYVAASFDAAGTTFEATAFIPEGQSSVTFPVFSRVVLSPLSVHIRAEYEGNFRIVNLNVRPWLQQLSLTPTSVVGGNQITGRVTIQRNAPVGGVPVTLTTNNVNLVNFPGGATVLVPAGQSTATFTVATLGTERVSNPTVTATLLGLGLSQRMTISQALLSAISFDPARVARGGTATGTVRLNGMAGASFRVQLSVLNPTGYTLTPSEVVFLRGERQKTFTIQTPTIPSHPGEPASTSRVVQASRTAQGTYPDSTAQGTLFIDGVQLASLTFNPTTVASGQATRGTVSIQNPAPSGGVRLFLSTNNAAAVPATPTVMIPAGATRAEFVVNNGVVDTSATVTVTAALAADISNPAVPRITGSYTLSGVAFTLRVQPSSLVGGGTSTATVTLAAPAPPTGITVRFSSSNPAIASVPPVILMTAGTARSVLVTTSRVTTQTNVTIRATIGGRSQSVTVTILPIGVGSLTFTPSTVRGGSVTVGRVMLDAPAPTGGAVVRLSATNTAVMNLPSTVTIPAGQTTVSFNVPTNRVARNIVTTVTATHNARSASATVTVTR